MSCEECPLEAPGELAAEALIEVLSRCDDCPALAGNTAAGRLTAALLEAGRLLRRQRKELRQLESTRDEMLVEAQTFESQLSVLQRLHRASSEELEAQLDVVRRQRDEIRRLSTPLLEVGEGVLVLPVIGGLDGERAQDMTYALLMRVHASKIRKVIIDITGVAATDPGAVERMAHMLGSARLLGAQVLVTGISPGLAAALVNRGVQLGEIGIARTVKEALARFQRD
ncbi:MAG: STAS domain-containing protein [Myxococcales bacterium]|nr:STAS domain-containing protein [Myxococcales bacterium]